MQGTASNQAKPEPLVRNGGKQQSARNIGKTVLSIVLGFALLLFFIFYTNPGKLVEALKGVSYAWLLPYAALIPCIYFLRALRWRELLRPSVNSMQFRTVFWTTQVGFMVNTIFPSRIGGELVRAYIIDEKKKVGFSKPLSSVAVERVLDLAAIVFLAFVALLLLPSGTGFPPWFLQAIEVVGASVVAIFLLIAAAMRNEEKLFSYVRKLISVVPLLKSSWKSRISNFVQSFIEGTVVIAKDRVVIVKSLALTLVLWITISGSAFLLFKAFQADVPGSVILLGSMLFQLSFVLPAPIAYVGTYQIFWSLIFGAITSVNLASLLAMAIIAQIIGTSATLVLGLSGLISLDLSFWSLLSWKPRSKWRPVEQPATVK